MSYTEAEERFIAAATPLINQLQRMLDLQHEMEPYTADYKDACQEVFGNLDDPKVDVRTELDRTVALLREAASRAGFAEDSEAVQELEREFEELRAVDALLSSIASSIDNAALASSNDHGGFVL